LRGLFLSSSPTLAVALFKVRPDPERESSLLTTYWSESTLEREREFFIDNLLVRIHFIIVMIRRTGLVP